MGRVQPTRQVLGEGKLCEELPFLVAPDRNDRPPGSPQNVLLTDRKEQSLSGSSRLPVLL